MEERCGGDARDGGLAAGGAGTAGHGASGAAGPGAPELTQKALIVESSGDRAALAAARDLWRAGWEVGVASASPGLAAASRSVQSDHRIAPSGGDPDAFVSSLNSAIAAGDYRLVLPGGGDLEVLTISRERDRIEALVPYGPHEGLVSALDKRKLYGSAAEAGLRVAGWADPGRIPDGWRPPFMLKAGLHTPSGGGSTAYLPTSVHRARDSLARAGEEMRRLGGEPLAQEMVSGPLVAFSTVTDRSSRMLARSQQVSDGIWPPGAGVSSRAHTVEVDPELARSVQKLLHLVNWFGVTQLQFIDSPDRGLVLIDFNGRFYGSMPLAIAAGARLPALWGAEALGVESPPATDARPGVTFQWLRTDLRRAARERRGGPVADLAASLGTAARRGTVHCLWSARDPRPSLWALRQALGRFRSRGGPFA